MDQRDEPMRRRSSNDSMPYAATYNTGQPPQPTYQPPQAYQPHYAPPTAKRKRTVPLWVTIVTGVVAFAIGAAAGSGSKSSDKTASPASSAATTGAATAAAAPPAPADQGPVGDVALGKFTVDAIGSVNVPVTITNHSSKTSNYIVEFEIDDSAGTKIGDGLASTNNLAPGQKAALQGVGITSSGTPVTVKVTKVTRYAS